MVETSPQEICAPSQACTNAHTSPLANQRPESVGAVPSEREESVARHATIETKLFEVFPMATTVTDSQFPYSDFLHLLAKSFKAILSVGVIGAVMGFLASQVVHPRWVANMAIQVGQVSIPAPGGGALVAQPIENQLTATERYNLPSFRLQVLDELGLPVPDSGSRDANLIFDSLKATAGRSSSVINVQVSAYSRESAAAALNAALKAFSAAHSKLFEQATSEMQSNLANARTKLAAEQRDQARTDQALKAASAAPDLRNSGTRGVLMSNTAALLNTQILALQQQVIAYQDGLSPLRSYPTKAMGPTYVPVRSSTPGPMVFTVAGAVLGLVASVGLILMKNSLRAS